MRLLGVVAEYNPFHNGHAYMLNEARRVAGADAVVVAMSGNFVQRGELAILDKWKRAELALKNGADIVLEIPTAFALADAGRYARAGVELLKGIGCDALAFGSESGDIDAIRRVASNLDEHAEELELAMAELSRVGLSYPAARQAAYEKLFEGSEHMAADLASLSSPNDILAIEYLRAAGEMEVFAIRREGAGYLDALDGENRFQSASGIREAIEDGKDYLTYVPSDCAYELQRIDTSVLLRRKRAYFQLARYAVLRNSVSEIDSAPSGGEGLASRLKSAVMSSDCVEELIEFAKSKRYTYTRISRLIAQTLLGITRADANLSVEYARLLGCNGRGRDSLSYLKRAERNRIPIITNINREMQESSAEAKRLIELDGLAVSIYNLLDERALYSNADRVRMPIIIKK